MKNFGKYAIVEPLRYHFHEEPSWWWQIRPPSAGDELALTRYINQGRLTRTEDGNIEEVIPTWIEIIFHEVALLFAGTNIPADPEEPLADGGKPFIKEDAEVSVISERLGEMPWEMIAEIADAIAEFVPGWGPKNPISRARADSETS